MADIIMTREMLEDVVQKRVEFKLSITQCCWYLYNKYGVNLSRQRMHVRIEKVTYL